MATRRTRTSRKSVRRSRKACRPWSREEIAFMRRWYRRYETSWVARQLRRSVYSIRYKAVDLNIRKAKPSVWKGQKGPKNAFCKPSSWTRKSKPATRRTTYRRKTSRSRSWRATSRRRTTRRARPRRRR